jgi:hypothetical protein
MPGLIDEKYKILPHQITYDKIRYNLFCGFTLGIGPVYIFFRDYDKQLKEIYKKKVT